MDDLPGKELGHKRLPLAVFQMPARVACECLIALEQSLLEIEHSLPELALDASRATAVVQVLGGQRPSKLLRMRVETEHPFQARRGAPRGLLRQRPELDHDGSVHSQRVIWRKRGEPALRSF